MKKLLLANDGKNVWVVVCFCHLAGLYIYGMIHHPLWTAAGTTLWLMLTLHFWPDEAKK